MNAVTKAPRLMRPAAALLAFAASDGGNRRR